MQSGFCMAYRHYSHQKPPSLHPLKHVWASLPNEPEGRGLRDLIWTPKLPIRVKRWAKRCGEFAPPNKIFPNSAFAKFFPSTISKCFEYISVWPHRRSCEKGENVTVNWIEQSSSSCVGWQSAPVKPGLQDVMCIALCRHEKLVVVEENTASDPVLVRYESLLHT
jgi:hypothetical protein